LLATREEIVVFSNGWTKAGGLIVNL